MTFLRLAIFFNGQMKFCPSLILSMTVHRQAPALMFNLTWLKSTEPNPLQKTWPLSSWSGIQAYHRKYCHGCQSPDALKRHGGFLLCPLALRIWRITTALLILKNCGKTEVINSTFQAQCAGSVPTARFCCCRIEVVCVLPHNSANYILYAHETAAKLCFLLSLQMRTPEWRNTLYPILSLHS